MNEPKDNAAGDEDLAQRSSELASTGDNTPIAADSAADEDLLVGEDDITVVHAGAPTGDANAESPRIAARKSRKTTLLPGEKVQESAAPGPGTGTRAADPLLADTWGVGPENRPGNYRVDPQQAQDATAVGKGHEAAVQRQSIADTRIVRDRFVILECLGKGGMGQIFKARDLRKEEADDDDPYVAIKFLDEAFSRHPRALISLQREAKKSQQLAHPNVLTVYDFDRDGDRVYMTMEFLNGATLAGWDSIKFLENRKPTIFSLIEQMASGLAYAHEQGVVHSDLKPDNVFVTVDGRIKILDFGIARIMDSALQKDSFDAGELGALSTRYASLEMLQGGAAPHPTDDVYALGLLAYQLFSGDHPYGGTNALDAHKNGVTAKPLKGLKRYQRKAIEGAIALERENRTQSAELFLRQFTGSKSRNRLLITTVFALVISSGYFAFEASQREGPSMPFDELATKIQVEFTRNIELGRSSSEIDDWDGASRYYIAAYELHPRNSEAEQGLELLAQHLVEVAENLPSPRQKEYVLAVINSYADNEYLANHEALAAVRLRLEGQ